MPIFIEIKFLTSSSYSTKREHDLNLKENLQTGKNSLEPDRFSNKNARSIAIANDLILHLLPILPATNQRPISKVSISERPLDFLLLDLDISSIHGYQQTHIPL